MGGIRQTFIPDTRGTMGTLRKSVGRRRPRIDQGADIQRRQGPRSQPLRPCGTPVVTTASCPAGIEVGKPRGPGEALPILDREVVEPVQLVVGRVAIPRAPDKPNKGSHDAEI